MSQENQDKNIAGEPETSGTPASNVLPTDTPEATQEAGAATSGTPDQETLTQPEPAVRTTGHKTGRGIALLALIIAALALVGTAWTWQDAQRQLASVSATGVAETGQRDALEKSVADLQRQIDTLEAGRAALEGARQDTFNDIAGLSQRLGNLERLVTNAQGVSGETRKRWILAEVEYLLQIANTRLQLARDVKSAKAALRLADGRLSAMEDPGLIELRGKIRSELMDLDAVKLPDIAGIAMSLGSLEARVDKLPLSRTILVNNQSPGGAPDEVASGWDRAVSKVGQAFSGIVSVRRTDQQVTPLLSPGEEYFLRRNLELKLEAARLALLNGAQTSYRESLRSAGAWLGEYFDTSDAAVSSAMTTLGELEAKSIQPAMPDISGSLALLRAQAAQDNRQ